MSEAGRPWEPGASVRLETPRFIVRSMAREDVDAAFLGWLADPEVMLGLNLPRRQLSRLQAVRWVLGFDNRARFCLGIYPRSESGGATIGFFTVVCDPNSRCADTSVVIGERSWWGRNVVIETRRELLDFLFDRLDLHKVTGRPHGRNIASIFNYKALGFTCEAVLREQLRSIRDDSRLDQLIFGMLRSEWQTR